MGKSGKRDGRVTPTPRSMELGNRVKTPEPQAAPPQPQVQPIIVIRPTIIMQAPPAMGGAPPGGIAGGSQAPYSAQQPLPTIGQQGYNVDIGYGTTGIPAAPSYNEPKASDVPNEYADYIANVTNTSSDYGKDKGMANVSM